MPKKYQINIHSPMVYNESSKTVALHYSCTVKTEKSSPKDTFLLQLQFKLKTIHAQ